MDLVEAYYKWNNLLQKMSQSKCHNCVKLEEHIKIARDIKKHKEEVNDLKFKMSDEALQQMPDFQGRVCTISLSSISFYASFHLNIFMHHYMCNVRCINIYVASWAD